MEAPCISPVIMSSYFSRMASVPMRWCIFFHGLAILRWDKEQLAREHQKWRCLFQMLFFCFFLLILFFPWSYYGRYLYLFSPGCYNEGTMLHFPVFSLARSFLQQKSKIGFHSTESNGSFFFLPLLVV